MAFHELLGKDLARFELCGLPVWTPGPQPILRKQINNTKCQRVIGPNDGQIRFLFPGKRKERRQVFCPDVDAFNGPAVRCDPLGTNPRVARRAPELRRKRRL